MPVKHGMLALLAGGASHGYQLKTDFEERTGGTWQLNIGQVYTTLQRLERDGLIEPDAADEDDAERRIFRITHAGRAALDGWYATPVTHAPPPRDELVIKVLVAIGSADVDLTAVMQRQRTATVEHLQALTRRKRDADPARDLGLLLHLDALILKAEAEVRWLDTCEARLRQHPPPPSGSATHDRTHGSDRSDRPDRPDPTDERPGDRARGGTR